MNKVVLCFLPLIASVICCESDEFLFKRDDENHILHMDEIQKEINNITITLEYNEELWWLNHKNIRTSNSQYEACPKGQFCRFRNLGLYPPKYWNLVTAGNCYYYSSKDWFNEKFDISYRQDTCQNTEGQQQSYYIPFNKTIINNETIYFDFDLSNELFTQIIKSSFKSDDYYQKFLDCCNAAIDCCDFHMNDENVMPSEEYPCPAMWDGWSCIEKTKPYETFYQTCPSYIYTSKKPVCISQSEKYCLKDGWNQTTNYEPCTFGTMLKKRHNFHIIALAISTALILPSIIIFTAFRTFRDGKRVHVVLHRNLLISLIIRNILTITSKSVVILDSLLPVNESNNVMADNSAGCRILSFVENVSKNAIFTCMLVDAFYLHKIICRAFAPEPKLIYMYIFTAVFSVTPSLIWAILMASAEMDNCWMVDDETWYQWITDGYKYLVLLINTLLLIHILVVLLQKCGRNATKQQTKSTLRATLFMLPLFGIPHLFTAQRNIVDTSTCPASETYYQVIYAIDALQGTLVAFLFCYLNGEVHNEFKNLFRKLNAQIRERFNMKNSNEAARRRRTTAMTNVLPSDCRISTSSPQFPRSNNANVEDWLSNSIKNNA